MGFGFETAFLPNYASGSFSENLLNSVNKRLSGPLVIRVGGTGGDKVVFDPDQEVAVKCIEGDCPVGFNAIFSLGPTYFDAFKDFQNQHFTFQAPMRPGIEWSESLEYVKRAYDAAGSDRVAAIALGNEVDLFEEVFHVDYSVKDYVGNASELEKEITNALNLSPSSRIFEVLDTTAGNGDNPFSLPVTFKEGIDSNNRVKYAAQHWYQSPTDLSSYGPDELQTYLMNHSAITSLFATGYGESIVYLNENEDPAIQYIISESGSSLAGPPLDYQATFGACLWAADFMLYGMSRGVKRIDLTQRPATWHSLWVPDDSTNDPSLGAQYNPGPQVRGPWFAMPMLADFVGAEPGAVVELLGEDTLTAYAMLDETSTTLGKVVILNMRFWSESDDKSRPAMSFTVPVGEGVDTVTVKRLQSEAGAYAGGHDMNGKDVTWAGETWSYEIDNGEGHFVDRAGRSETVEVCDGVALVQVRDSEAVIVLVDNE